jgi:hypothetical protein
MEIYRKRGAVVRWENGVLVRVMESGEASDDGTTFRCAPLAGPSLPPIDASRVLSTVESIRSLAGTHVSIERLLVSEGIAEHELDERRWSERSERVHLSLTRGTLRVLLDLGMFALNDISVAVQSLARADERERIAPESLALAPIVTAALLPALVNTAPPGLELWQRGGGFDGRGEPIQEARIDGREPPNLYRPSYRMRPVRLPLNVHARTSDAAENRVMPRAVALLAPVHGPVLRVLIDDGVDVYPATVRVGRIQAVSAEAIWYPYGAGSFGAEMVL